MGVVGVTADTSARLLALLGLFQSRPSWTGTELAERLGVTTRTIRNDVERLRNHLPSTSDYWATTSR